jgi:tRNA (mo5U34)-methyltransferase
MYNKHIEFKSIGLRISIADSIATKIRSNIIYRHLIRPAIHFLDNRNNHVTKQEPRESAGEAAGMPLKAAPAELTPEQIAIHEKIAVTDWYHSIELGHGVVTPGLFDHRPYLSLYHLPENVRDMRVLDVGTNNGFWAFEFEKRGAAEVVAIDIKTCSDFDLPPRIRAQASREELDKETGIGYEIASEILGSKVQKKILSIYDLSPEELGEFDIVNCSDLLLHLINPMKALQRIHSVVSDYALITDIFDPKLGEDEANTVLHYLGAKKKNTWWIFGLGSLKEMILDAGFSKVEVVSKFELSYQGAPKQFWRAVLKAYK